jgi:CheY-like chemotaxis protein/HPt (histidine-containing phosphotransfer) domain-containing protein
LSELLGGALTVGNTVGQGSQFELIIPLSPANRLEQNQESSKARARFPASRILVAEDNRVNQRLAEYMLENRGPTVSVVGDGRRAYEAVREHTYDLVLMDCQMPDWDGMTATRAIRRWERETGQRRTPIVALTANAMDGFDKVCLEAGMDGYLAKPLEEQRLMECLGRWLPAEPETETSTTIDRASSPPTISFDLGRVSTTCRSDPGRIREMLELFIASTQDLLRELAEAAARKDAPAAKRAAHQIKGACAYLGAKAMTALASEIEQSSLQGDWPRTETLQRDLETEFIRVHTDVDSSLGAQDG